jgi:hypothetical protein
MEWLSTASIEIDFGQINDPNFIYHRTPKKLRAPLTIDHSGKTAPIGWAIWIDEDFSVPWHVPALLGLLCIGILIYAIVYTAENEPKANGYTIGSLLAAIVSLMFTALVLKAKDSKHARM